MKVLFVASECHPFIKTGGLGDVAWALPRALKKAGVEVGVILPNYDTIPEEYRQAMTHLTDFPVNVSYRSQYCGINHLVIDDISYYFVDNMYYFARQAAYGYIDDGERFAFFSQAVIEAMEKIDFIPDVLHCNDWHSAMIPLLLKVKYSWISAYDNIKTMLTIHNLKFQGIFPFEVLGDLLSIGDSVMVDEGVEYYGNVNFMKGGINYADAVTTVSPTYAREITYKFYGEGLDGLMRRINYKLSGIINGIDTDINNPETDPAIAAHYSRADLSGKALCKKALQQELHLPEREDVPIISIVSRLTDQKGLDILAWVMEDLLSQDVQFVVLGTGEEQYENMFRHFQGKYPEKMSAQILFDGQLAQRVYAGSDMILIPSRFEPSGLTQMIAMRYGTVPIVRETGGLFDTVKPYNQFEGTGLGFPFAHYYHEDLKDAIHRALAVYKNQEEWKKMMLRGMAEDFSWDKSAQRYLELYQEISH